jgi:hypothetical protein
VSAGLVPIPLPDGRGIAAADWQQTPTSVWQHCLSLLKRIESLGARVHHDSFNSSRPPSTNAPAKKRQRRIGTRLSPSQVHAPTPWFVGAYNIQAAEHDMERTTFG